MRHVGGDWSRASRQSMILPGSLCCIGIQQPSCNHVQRGVHPLLLLQPMGSQRVISDRTAVIARMVYVWKVGAAGLKDPQATICIMGPSPQLHFSSFGLIVQAHGFSKWRGFMMLLQTICRICVLSAAGRLCMSRLGGEAPCRGCNDLAVRDLSAALPCRLACLLRHIL